MDYILTLNEKIRSFEKYYAERTKIVNRIFTLTKILLNTIHSEKVNYSKANKAIKEIEKMISLYKINKKELDFREIELRDISVRISKDYPDTNPRELIDIDGIKNRNGIKNLYDQLILCSKLSKTLEFLNLIIKDDNIGEMDLSYIELTNQLNYLIKDLTKQLSEEEQIILNDSYPMDKKYDAEEIYLLEPVIEEVEETKKEVKPIKQEIKMIIEAKEFNQSIEEYENYLAEKYENVGYRVEFNGNKRKPYPHEQNLAQFKNAKGETIYITKNYADKDYYDKTYIPYITQKGISIEDMLEKIKDIKNKIYETIVRTIISKEKKINPNSFNAILEFLVGNEYQTDEFVRYVIEKEDNEFLLNIYVNKEKITAKLEYNELYKLYKQIYQELLPIKPVFNSESIQHTDSNNSIIFRDATSDKELNPVDRKKIIKAYIKNKIKTKKWLAGEQYQPTNNGVEGIDINFFANSNEYKIYLEKTGPQIVL